MNNIKSSNRYVCMVIDDGKNIKPKVFDNPCQLRPIPYFSMWFLIRLSSSLDHFPFFMPPLIGQSLFLSPGGTQEFE